jgi:hypothetical protein
MHVIESLLLRHLNDSARFQDIYYPLGFPVIVSSNSEAVRDAARIEWDSWEEVFDEPPIVLHFEVSAADSPQPEATHFHAQGHLFAFVADADHVGVCDTQTGSGTAWLTAAALQSASYFSYHFLEAMALELIVSLHLTPFHAACVERAGHGTLLCGDSGMGKSSLAYGCARRGWTFLSDDASYLVRRRAKERLVLGHSHRVRLRPDAPRFFPELTRYAPTLRGNGKMGLDLHTRTLGITAAPSAAVDRIVILRRTNGGRNRLTRVDASAAREICEPIFYWWDASIAAEQQTGFDALLAASRVFTLEYSDLDSAIDLLES